MLFSKQILKQSLYHKFLGFLIKKGNKIKAKKILDTAFLQLAKRTGHSFSFLLFKLFAKLNTFVESKTIKNKRRAYQVPFIITLDRRAYLAIKWLMKVVLENKNQIPIADKIADEIYLILKTSSSRVLKLRSINTAQALANRSNIHFRW